MTSAAESGRLIEAFYSVLAARDREALLALLDPQIRVTYHAQPGQLPWAGEFVGIDGFDEFLTLVADRVEIVEVERRMVIADRDNVAVPCRGRWRIKETGSIVEGGMVNLFTVADSRITAYEVFADTAAFAAGLSS